MYLRQAAFATPLVPTHIRFKMASEAKHNSDFRLSQLGASLSIVTVCCSCFQTVWGPLQAWLCLQVVCPPIKATFPPRCLTWTKKGAVRTAHSKYRQWLTASNFPLYAFEMANCNFVWWRYLQCMMPVYEDQRADSVILALLWETEIQLTHKHA